MNTISIEQVQQTKTLIDRAVVVHVYTHVNPDGDAVASVRAVELALNDLGKTAICRFNEPLPEIYEWLGITSTLDRDLPLPDLVIIVDTERLGLLGPIQNCVELAIRDNVPILNIDHHPGNHHFGTCNLIAKSSSTTQNIYEFFRQMGWFIDKEIASALLFGLVCDTQSFQCRNSDWRAIEVASELVRFGAIPYFIAQRFYKNKDLQSMKLWGRAFDSLETYFDGQLVICAVTYEMFIAYQVDSYAVTGLSNFLMGLQDVRLVILLKQVERRVVEISLRSEPIFNSGGEIIIEAPDVSWIARQFGGGGHVVAAGCSVQGSIEEVKPMILEVCLTVLGYDQT